MAVVLEQPIMFLVNGQAGSGKTSCGRCLFELLAHSALLDIDDLTRVEPFCWGSDLALLGIQNAAAAACNFFESGFTQVVLSGGVFRQDQFEALAAALPDGTCCHYLWLHADCAVRHRRCLERARDAADTEEFLEFRDTLMPRPDCLKNDFGQLVEIDSSALTATEAAEALLGQLDDAPPRLRTEACQPGRPTW